MASHPVRRALSIFLVVSLLATSTLAAPQTIVAVATEWQSSLAFWLRANGLPGKLARVLSGQSNKPRPQEKQEERDARVTRLQIYPGDTTIGVDGRISFAAVAYDLNNATVGGVAITWHVQDVNGQAGAVISSNGQFEGKAPGRFKVIAEAAGQTTQANVIVLPTPGGPNPNDVPQRVRRVSSRDLPSQLSPETENPDDPTGDQGEARSSTRNSSRDSSTKWTRNRGSRRLRQLKAHAAPLEDVGGWGDSNYTSADDPGNGRGDPPGHPVDNGAGSGNFQLTAPVLSLPGRGIDISLGLSYNSRVWNKAGNVINFDIDRDWPAPGWSLGFGKILDLGAGGSMLVDPDGTRHPFTGTLGPSSGGTLFTGHTTDGTLIQYQTWKNASGVMTFGEANPPNGSQVHYYGVAPGGVFPTDIVDANGNLVIITYVSGTGRIQTITDTLGRVVSFFYDSHNNLTAITTPRLGIDTGERTLVRLTYHQVSLNSSSYSFALTPVVRNPNPWLIDAIYYPGTGTGYWFGDTDSYSTYGMLAKAVEARGMTFSGPDPIPAYEGTTEQGTITAGQMTRKEVYNYPLFVGDNSGTASSSLTDAPTYTSMIETWTRDDNPNNTDSATTNYQVLESAPNPPQPVPTRQVTVTFPNGSKSIQYSYNYTSLPESDARKALDGLVYQDELRDSADTMLQSSTAAWEKGSFDSPRPTRIDSTDERLHTTATTFVYGSNYNQVTELRSYDYGGTTLLRSVKTEYQNSPNYTSARHIFNLPLAVDVFAADDITRVSHTEYQYDSQTLENTPGVTGHSANHNPYAFGYNPITDYRGNVTQITRYAEAVAPSGGIAETRRYDITGNLIKTSTSCCEQTTFSYNIDTQYGYPASQTRGSATDPYAQVTRSATFDFQTGLVLSSVDPNGRTSQTTYFSETLRPETVSRATLAHTDFAYDDTAMKVTETTYLEAHTNHTTIADQNVRLLNGRRQVRQEQSLGASGVWDLVDTVYDNMGRLSQQSQPYRNGQTPRWNTATYDARGRTRKVIGSDYTLPDFSDGSTTQTFYNESNRPSVASAAFGETARVVDAWGRERWARTDAQGRLVEVVEPNPSGSGSVFEAGALLTTYSYNTAGNLTGVNQHVQTRSFKYDALGRLIAQKLAEANATLNDAGAYQTSGGTWSDVFAYDDRSNLISRADARGVKTLYNFNNDPLNRIQSVSWDTSGFGDSANPILSAATVSYQYRTKSSPSQLLDVTQVSSVNTSGVSTESFSYDVDARIYSKALVLTNRPSYPFVTDYTYDALDRITDVSYPAEYGNGSHPRKVVHHNYDVASRLASLTFDGQAFAGNIAYNAASETTSLNVGNGPNQILENYSYDAQTGMLNNQTVARGSTTLLNLSYEYLRAGTTSGRTGQLTKIVNNLNPSHNKDRNYAYDALGRLTQATGGEASAPLWTQTYSYDIFGNRTAVSSTGYSANLRERDKTPAFRKEVPDSANVVSADTSVEPAIGTRTELAAAATGLFEPRVSLPTEQPTAQSRVEPSDQGASRSNRSHHASRAAGTPPSPQSGSPVFTEDPLNSPSPTPIKALHITELRGWIDQLRVRVGLAAASWQEPVAPGLTIAAPPVQELRTKLDAALSVLHLTTGGYSAGLAQNLPVLAIHIQELRDRVKAAWNSASAIPRDGLASVSYDLTSNRITTAGFDYDKAGNQVRALAAGGGAQRFQYDAANRLVKIKADDNVTVLSSYTYGSSNERLVTDEGGVRTYYACDGGGVSLAEYTETGNSVNPIWSRSYVYLGARLLSVLTPNGSGGEFAQYHHADRLGTRLVTNAQNTTSFEQVGLPFGTALNAESTGSTNRRFTSYDRSTISGLDYAINRHYDSQQGRFTQVDPIGMGSVSLINPQTLNLYAYCANDPINHSDPEGLGFFSFLKKIFKAIGKFLTNKWVLIVVGIAAGLASGLAFYWAIKEAGGALVGFFIKAGIILAGVSATLIASAFHPNIQRYAQIIGGIVSSAQSILGLLNPRILGTPPWNPGSAIGPASSLTCSGGGCRRRRPGAFQTINEAAIAALRLYDGPSISAHRELNGSICESADGSLTFTIPKTGTMASSTPSDCAAGTTRVATYHTHGYNDPGYNNEIFSNADKINSNNRSLAAGHLVPIFVGTPGGAIKRFDPAVISNSTRGRVTVLKARINVFPF